MSNVREELNTKVREGRIESRHSIEFSQIASRSHDLGHMTFDMDCDAFSNEEKLAEVVQLTNVDTEVTGQKTTSALSLCTLLSMCRMKTAIFSTY